MPPTRSLLHVIPIGQLVRLVFCMEAASVDAGAGLSYIPVGVIDANLQMLRHELRRREYAVDDASKVGGGHP